MTMYGLFFFLFVFINTDLIQLIVKKFANDLIQTADLWYQKRVLYQPYHNHCPKMTMFLLYNLSHWSRNIKIPLIST